MSARTSLPRSPGGAAADGPAPAAATGERAVPYHCPYCAEQDLRPLGPAPGAWHCRTCTRTFSMKYLGMKSPIAPWEPEAGTTPGPTETGAHR
jgi:hypothetical protein